MFKNYKCNYLENSTWFKELLTFNKEEFLKSSNDSKLINDDDLLLIPHVIEKTVLVKLIHIAENIYDPMSSQQTIRFAKLISQLVNDYPTVNSKSANTKVNKKNIKFKM